MKGENKLTNLNEIAINNLKLINSLSGPVDNFDLVIDGNNITKTNENNYDGIFCLRELEYPIYFSFHQLFNSLRYSNIYKIDNYKTNEIIDIIDSSIDKIIDILNEKNDDPHNKILCNIMDDIDEKYDIIRERHDTCSFWKIYEIFNDYLDIFCESLKECNRYLYISHIPLNSIYEKINKNTREINPNLIYSDDEFEDNQNTDYDSEYEDSECENSECEDSQCDNSERKNK